MLHVLRDVYVNFASTPIVHQILLELPLADEANLAQLHVSAASLYHHAFWVIIWLNSMYVYHHYIIKCVLGSLAQFHASASSRV